MIIFRNIILVSYFCIIIIQLVDSSLSSNQNHEINFQDASLIISTNSSETLIISIRNEECFNCKYNEVAQICINSNASIRLDTTYPNYYFLITNIKDKFEYCSSTLFAKPVYLGENGTYSLEIFINKLNISESHCLLNTIVEPDNIYIPIYVSIGLLVLFSIIFMFGKLILERIKNNLSSIRYSNDRLINSEFGASTSSQLELNNEKRNPSIVKSNRLKSIDALRGLVIFFMIFANYGSGGYGFLDHAVWNGLHLADIVFPSFIFIMGISIPLSYKAMCLKAQNTPGVDSELKFGKLLYKILKRSVLLFFFGLLVGNSSDQKLTHLRIMGVLQRFSLTYLVCALIELVYLHVNNYKYNDNQYTSSNNVSWSTSKLSYIESKFQEIFFYKYQWLVSLLFVFIWCLLTFLLPVEGCKTGYLGPGGWHENGTHFNCTGGAAGVIDRYILGVNHVYQSPTCSKVYLNQLPHDPEGLLGCLTSFFLAYLGIKTGHIFIHYQNHDKRRVKFLMYSVFYGILAGILTSFDKENGVIPINKNLWSLSFVLAAVSIDYLILIIFYSLIDFYKIYSGNPFMYLGRNSITIYICHEIFIDHFPFFQISDTHGWLMFKDLYGIAIWCTVAAYMDYNKVYISL